VTEGGDVLFSPGVAVQLLASGGNTFSWTPSEGLDDPTIANPKATPSSEVTYTVTGSQIGLCNGSLSFNMKFDPAANDFYAPNAFSPNGDANNDVWVISNATNFSDCTIAIFTKHGSKVFEQKGYTSNWDGTYEGKELPQGTYYYVLNCPDKKPVTGHILLAR
jgi:gliding motility-associated-like protein